MRPISRKLESQAIATLMPRIIQGIQLDFFVQRGVTQTQFLVLVAIHGYGRCTMGTLSRNLHVRMPTATGIIDRLGRAGYVRRLLHSTDRRQVFVSLTPKGQAFIRQFQAIVRRRWEEVLRTLGPTELATFYRVILRLTEQLQSKP